MELLFYYFICGFYVKYCRNLEARKREALELRWKEQKQSDDKQDVSEMESNGGNEWEGPAQEG